MNVGKGSKVRLLSRGGEVEYSVESKVSLDHFIDMLRRLEALDATLPSHDPEPDVEGVDRG